MFARPLLLAGLTGLIAVFFAVLTGLPLREYKSSFNYPKGISEPMLALEFIPDSAALHAFLGEAPGSRSCKLKALDMALMRDNFFAGVYTLFLIVFAISAWFITRHKKYWFLIPLALLIGFSDIVENTHIRNVLDASVLDDAYFKRVHFFAWIKWLGLVVFFQFCATLFRSGPGLLGKSLAFWAWLGPLMAVMAFVSDKMVQPFTIAMMYFVFPLTIIFCFLYKNRT